MRDEEELRVILSRSHDATRGIRDRIGRRCSEGWSQFASGLALRSLQLQLRHLKNKGQAQKHLISHPSVNSKFQISDTTDSVVGRTTWETHPHNHAPSQGSETLYNRRSGDVDDFSVVFHFSSLYIQHLPCHTTFTACFQPCWVGGVFVKPKNQIDVEWRLAAQGCQLATLRLASFGKGEGEGR